MDADVTIVREELLLRESAPGKIVPLVEAGERVGAGQEYAAACASEQDAEALTRQQTLQQRLQWLRESDDAINYHAVNVRNLGLQVDETFTGLLAAYDRGQFTALAAAQEAFLYRSTTLEAALGGQMNLSSEIAAVEGQLAEIKAMALESRTQRFSAPAAGYYDVQTDGLEEILTPKAIEKLTPEAWAKLSEMPPASTAAAQGRLIKGFTWYAVAVLTAEDAQQLRQGQGYTVQFPLESARRFTMTVRSLQRGADGTVAVVLSADQKDDVLLRLRTARARIVLATYKGLEIPAAALRFQEKGEGSQKRTFTGVYILKGSQLLQREVQLLHQTDDGRAIVAWGETNENRTLEGDRVTVRGQIQSAVLQEGGELLLMGQDLHLTAENTHVPSTVEDGKEVSVVTKKSTAIFDEVLLKAAKDLRFAWEGADLVVTGEGLSYQERRGTGLKIYDAVLVKGRVPEDAGE
ncbi:MAG: hypothetical protein LBS96_03405 [Oscillospiraceae bacterium]|jgi:putative membrane fusion protein|nr:hypothetical protein [Oscillospiraceae bacterium]